MFLSEVRNQILTEERYRYSREDMILMNNLENTCESDIQYFCDMVSTWNRRIDISDELNLIGKKVTKNMLLAYVAAFKEILEDKSILHSIKAKAIEDIKKVFNDLNRYIKFMCKINCAFIFDYGIRNGILPDELISYDKLIVKLLKDYRPDMIVSSISDYIRETDQSHIINELTKLEL